MLDGLGWAAGGGLTMERLTLSDYGKFKIPPPTGTKEKERPSYMDLYCRLAAIEDILGDDYELDRPRELVEADREGRVEIIEPDVYECIKAVRKAQAALRREQE